MKRIWKTILVAFSAVCALCALAGCAGGAEHDSAMHRHVLFHYTKSDPTCTTAGNKEYWECTTCHKLFADGKAETETAEEELEIAPLPHTEAVDKGVEATCTKDGLTDGKHCSVCHIPLESQKPVHAKGHTVVTDEAVEATCTEDGLTEGKHCSVCKDVLLPQKAVPAKGHTEAIDRAVEATCSEDGKTEGSHCSVCGEVFVAQEVIPSKGHKWNDKNVCSVCGLGWNATDGLEFTLNDDGESYSVSGIGTASGKIVIPYVYKGKPVTAIGDSAFAVKVTLTEIAIPDSVVSIGKDAFIGCPNLTRVSIPNSVISIGYDAFRNCKNLIEVVMSNHTESIGDYAFDSCGLSRITIPDSVKSIGECAFRMCAGLTEISISKNVAEIGENAFELCTNLSKITVASGNSVYHAAGDCLIETETKKLILGCQSSVIPSDGSVSEIGNYAFSGCKKLTSVRIPDSVTTIGVKAFDNSGITGIVIPKSVTNIMSYAFSSCSDLANITVEMGNPKYHSVDDCLIETEIKTLILGCKNSVIPSDGSVTQIGNIAFYGISSLNIIEIPDKIQSIGGSAFAHCVNLTSIEISNSVKSIGEMAFYDCRRLSLIAFRGTKAEWKKIEKGREWCEVSGDFTVQCKDGKLDKDENEIN